MPRTRNPAAGHLEKPIDKRIQAFQGIEIVVLRFPELGFFEVSS